MDSAVTPSVQSQTSSSTTTQTPPLDSPQPIFSFKAKIILTFCVIVSLTTTAFAIFYNPTPYAENATQSQLPTLSPTPQPAFTKQSESQLIFTGGYADPTILKQDDGTLIIYLNNFSQQPSRYQAYSSTDEIEWTLINGPPLPSASTGRIVKFPNLIRLYYPELT